MKPKSHVRIVCLKNKESNKDHQQHRSLVVSQNNSFKKATLVEPAPSLVHLSARLQDQSKDSNIKRDPHIDALSMKSPSILQSQTKYLSVQKKQQECSSLNIEKYFEIQKAGIIKQKSTIKNIMGDVDFSTDRLRQKKIARILQQTIKKGEVKERFVRKKFSKENAIKLCCSQNRTGLEEDFKNFINNKQGELKDMKVIQQDEEDKRKLCRLSVINPERQTNQKSLEKDSKSLDLFHFLAQNKLKSNQKLSPLRQEQTANNRLQRKMFKLALNMKTQQEDFQWSKVPSGRGFKFSTLNR